MKKSMKRKGIQGSEEIWVGLGKNEGGRMEGRERKREGGGSCLEAREGRGV